MLLALVSGLALTSCHKDEDADDNGSSLENNIIGTWSIDFKNSTNYASNNNTVFEYYQFQDDGTFISVKKDNLGVHVLFAEYSLSGNDLKMVSHALYDITSNVKCKILNNDKMYMNVSNADRYLVLNRVKDDEVDCYISRVNINDYFKDYEVNLDQYEVDLNQCEVDLSVNSVSELTCPDGNHPHAIDMGEAGIWSCCNVGASNPADFGCYYAWGENEDKNYYDLSNYIHYDTEFNYIGDDISGGDYDVAHVKWGKGWKMPSAEKMQALIDNCSSEWKILDLYNNCYLIDGKGLKIDNGGNNYLINGKVYKLDNINDYKDCYLINDNIYQIDNLDNYYIINNKPYKIVNNLSSLYYKDNYIYIFNGVSSLTGIKTLLQLGLIKGFKSYENNSLEKVAVNLEKMSLPEKVYGRIFNSNTGNSIFMPAAGGKRYNKTEFIDVCGRYWSSTYHSSYLAYLFFFSEDQVLLRLNGYREEGNTVRPIME